jgi:hypothetical protein
VHVPTLCLSGLDLANHHTPFGNAQPRYAFTRLIKPLLRRWRERLGIRCLAWLDDIIGLHQCPYHMAWAVQQICWTTCPLQV